MYIFVEKLLSDGMAGIINTPGNIFNPSFSRFKGTIPVVKSSTNDISTGGAVCGELIMANGEDVIMLNFSSLLYI